ncbi:hypothetical protein RvY_06152 [Ramazzottius varieornatus]|uniref:Uncharacterized protein n=1 Tax=Ramazzottius varieornatus TaxID=947166 RepID=A0A1D1V3Z5_RAMVA|nr:hypothetical protein RvY_06152 [Ramazzottius varieornatus]
MAITISTLRCINRVRMKKAQRKLKVQAQRKKSFRRGGATFGWAGVARRPTCGSTPIQPTIKAKAEDCGPPD